MRVNEIEWKQEMKWEKDYTNRPRNAADAAAIVFDF